MNLPFVLDVAIGIVFIYLILSLLASEMQELITTLLQWRAKHLKDSIEVLLAGGIDTPEEAQVKGLVDQIYNDPLLKNVNQQAKGLLAGGVRRIAALLPGNQRGAYGKNQSSGPSYIAPETFATALTDQLGVSTLVDKLTKIRLRKFFTQMVGQYNVGVDGKIDIPSDDTLNNNFEKGKIRLIAERCGIVGLNTDPQFENLVEEAHGYLQDYDIGQVSLETTITRMGESLDRYATAYAPALPGDPNPSYRDRLQALKLSVFGKNNERAISSGGLRPSLTEVSELVNRGSTIYREVLEHYNTLKTQLPPIEEKIQSSLQAQLDEQYTKNPDPVQGRLLKLGDLPRGARDRLLKQALSELPPEESDLYQDYQVFLRIDEVLDRIPSSVKDSIKILSERAQSRVRQVDNQVAQLREEMALWFDRSMSRASGVYRRNAKGVAIILGFILACVTNADTFHIFNRLSSDDTLRDVIRNSAVDVARTDGQPVSLDDIKNRTDTVLRSIALPISWTPTNLTRQFDCPPAVSTARLPTSEQEWNTMFSTCLNEPAAAGNLPFATKIGKTLQIAATHPWEGFKIIIGWLISGFAIAMGAPFWFDLLGKIVNVRNSGSKPKPLADPQGK